MQTNLVKKILLVISFTALACSLFLNYSLYNQLWVYYKALYTVELDPLGLSQFPENTPVSSEKPIVVFFGDSRAAQWPAPTTDSFVFINRGIGNQTSEQIASRFDVHVKPLKPDVVVLQVCVNDLKTIPLFPELEDEIVANCKKNIQQIIQSTLNIPATIVVTTIIPPAERIPLARRLVWSDNIYNALNETNDFIAQLSSERVIVYDAAQIITNADQKTKLEYSTDFLHLNETGYQLLNDGLIETLTTIKQTSH